MVGPVRLNHDVLINACLRVCVCAPASVRKHSFICDVRCRRRCRDSSDRPSLKPRWACGEMGADIQQSNISDVLSHSIRGEIAIDTPNEPKSKLSQLSWHIKTRPLLLFLIPSSVLKRGSQEVIKRDFKSKRVLLNVSACVRGF